MPGFCKVAKLEEVREHKYALTPGRYVGSADGDEDDEPFEEKLPRLTALLKAQMTNGVLKPDRPLPLPDQSRVRLTVEPIEEWSPERSRAAWEQFKALAAEHPINSGGVRYTRDELHERR